MQRRTKSGNLHQMTFIIMVTGVCEVSAICIVSTIKGNSPVSAVDQGTGLEKELIRESCACDMVTVCYLVRFGKRSWLGLK